MKNMPRFVLGAAAVLVSVVPMLLADDQPAVTPTPAAPAGNNSPPAPSYVTEITPILTKYCVGCHNDADLEGKLSLESYASLSRGGKHGAVILAGDAAASRLFRVLTGASKPTMPPEGEPAPSADEIRLLMTWLNAGAGGPEGVEPGRLLVTPHLPHGQVPQPITSLAFAPDGKQVAVARYRQIDLQTPDGRLISRLPERPGKITSVSYSQNGKWLVAASGTTGLSGLATIFDAQTGQVVREFEGHRDILYAAVLSPEAGMLATGSYDREIILWDTQTGAELRRLVGHNGAVFDLAFTPDGKLLASASGDATVKVWRVADGARMDTLSQPLKEQYSVDISPDGQFVIAAGEDNRIRMWRLISTDQPRINPLVFARFAHDAAIHRVRYVGDGSRIVSASADRSVKLWQADSLAQTNAWENQPDSPQALAVSSSRLLVGRMDGSLEAYDLDREVLPVAQKAPAADSQPSLSPPSGLIGESRRYSDQEPNDNPSSANEIALPAVIAGFIDARHLPAGAPSHAVDQDYYRFEGRAGATWIFEIKAARDGSSLDSYLQILDAQGQPVPRVDLRAVRDSYFTFRGKDSLQTGDFRLFNWNEMKLNQLLYANGEVVKLYHYPRGPDSGFNVYPNFGERFTYFDTTPVAHALNEPCYIVEPYEPGSRLPPNGLPVFTINYENDDDSERQWGKDSRITFRVPRDGHYLVAIKDARGFSGAEFKYELTIRPPRPDFQVHLSETNPTVPPGGGQRFNVRLDRIDGFQGPVQIDVDGLPAGFHLAAPIQVEAGQHRAWGLVMAADDAVAPTAATANQNRVWASAIIAGQPVRREVGSLGEIKLGMPAKIQISLQPDQPAPPAGDLPWPVWEVTAGQTSTATIRIERGDFSDRVAFGSEEAAINSPHGVYVGNTGLNGVLIVEGQTERQIFLNVEDWVQPAERIIFVEAGIEGRPTSNPILLRVVPGRQAVPRN